MALEDRAAICKDGEFPFYSFKPVPLVKTHFLEDLHFNLSTTSVGASTARRMGPPGTIKAATSFLRGVDLRRVKRRSRSSFDSALEELTNELAASLPVGGQHWGSSRKFINIFLRNCLYNRYVCAHYSFERVENWLEVPLDSQVAKRLKKEAGRGNLPRWTTVIGLTSVTSNQFQDFATKLAYRHHIARVHLDIKFWRAASKNSIRKSPSTTDIRPPAFRFHG